MDENVLSVLALFVSVIAVVFGFFANRTAKAALTQAEEDASATILKEYADHFFSRKERLRPLLQDLEVVCQQTERCILRLLDDFSPSQERPLRHELSDFTYQLVDEWLPKVLSQEQNNYHGISRSLWEYEFDHPDNPCVRKLNQILDQRQKQDLAQMLHAALSPYWALLRKIKPELHESVLWIESSISKSRIAGYPISKNRALDEEMRRSHKVFYLLSVLELHQMEAFEQDGMSGGYTISAFVYSVTVLRIIPRLIDLEVCSIERDPDIENAQRFGN